MNLNTYFGNGKQAALNTLSSETLLYFKFTHLVIWRWFPLNGKWHAVEVMVSK